MSNSPKKVALLLHDLEEGGMQSVCLNLIQEFDKHSDIELELVLSNKVGGFLSRIPSHVKIIDLAIPFQLCLKYIYSLTITLSKYLSQAQPDVILSNLPFVNLITLLAKFKSLSPVSTILVEHTLPLECSLQREGESNKLGKRFVKIMSCMMRMLYARADYIILPSHGVAGELSQVIALKTSQFHKLKVIYNPVVDTHLAQKAAAVLEHPWFRADQPPVFLAVGRLVPQKDYETLLHGFALLRRSIDAHLVILGDGPMRPQLEALTQKLDLEQYVSFPGFVDNPYAYMSRASAFVQSSVWETFGVVLVEALACGCPVISTDCDYGPAEVLEQGKYGTLVPVQDAQALAQAMHTVLTRLEDDQGVLQERSQAFSLEQSAQQYLTLMGIEETIPEMTT